MRDWQSQSHVKWYCKCHVVFVPKYRRRAIYGNLRKKTGGILRDLCQQQGIEIVEGHAMARSYPSVPERSAEVQHCEQGGFPERQISDQDPQGVFGAETKLHGKTLLDYRVLCEHRGLG